MRCRFLGVMLFLVGWIPVLGAGAIAGILMLLGWKKNTEWGVFRFAWMMSVVEMLTAALGYALLRFHAGAVPAGIVLVIPALLIYGGMGYVVYGENFRGV